MSAGTVLDTNPKKWAWCIGPLDPHEKRTDKEYKQGPAWWEPQNGVLIERIKKEPMG